MSRLSSTTLRIGDVAPPIALPGLDGQIVELAEARGICGVLLLFTPGAWSPATRRQLGEVNAVYEQFRDRAVQVVVLMTQSARALQDRLAAYAIPFPILADERREAARDYGVYRAISWDGFGVTRPAAFMVDRDGIIRFMYVGERASDMPDTESLLRIAIWTIGIPPVEETKEEPVQYALSTDIDLDRRITDENGVLIAELVEEEPADEAPAEVPEPVGLVAGELAGVGGGATPGPVGDGGAAENELALATNGQLAEASAPVEDNGDGAAAKDHELTAAGAAERPGPDRPQP